MFLRNQQAWQQARPPLPHTQAGLGSVFVVGKFEPGSGPIVAELFRQIDFVFLSERKTKRTKGEQKTCSITLVFG